jgi:MinD superfamily P-loop ATPase
MLIIGGSGSGKTTLVMELIKRMKNTFNHILLCCKSSDEPLYELLAKKVPNECLSVAEGMDAIPQVQDLSGAGQTLAIFDDLCIERGQQVIEEYFIRGRKVGEGVSCIYLTQSYYQTPKIIRLQCGYFCLKKLNSERDLNMILSECSLGVDKKELLRLYREATREQRDFLMIDMAAPADKRFRHNFLRFL